MRRDRWQRMSVPLGLAFMLSACSSSAKFAGSSDTGSTAGDEDVGTTDTGAADTGLVTWPLWWRLSAQLTIEADGIQAAKSSLEISLIDERDEVICTARVALVSAESIAATSSAVLAWWSVEPEASETLCGVYTSPLPEALQLGVGELHPDIRAAMASFDNLAEDAPLNGAYASMNEPDSVLVFGVAGLQEAYEGQGEAAEVLPLADGLWSILPIYRFTYTR